MSTPSLNIAPRLGHWLRRGLRQTQPPVTGLAAEHWEIWPEERAYAPPAIFLPGQLERIRGWAFVDSHPGPGMTGGEVVHGATRAHLIKDVWLINGALYKKNAMTWLAPPLGRWTSLRAEDEIERAGLYCSVIGNTYFGSWLIEDCVTYALASAEGIPVTVQKPPSAHAAHYEDWLGMTPRRLRTARFAELVLFDDAGQNTHKRRRFRAMVERLRARVGGAPGESLPGRVPGLAPVPVATGSAPPNVFLLRGSSGVRRLLDNELEVAEYLEKCRGFRILDPMREDVPTLLTACAGADVVMGVEGSQLAHGMAVLREGGTLFALQPPNRFVRVYKDMTDRDRQHFAFVVGEPTATGFRVDPEEVARTLDLIPGDWR